MAEAQTETPPETPEQPPEPPDPQPTSPEIPPEPSALENRRVREAVNAAKAAEKRAKAAEEKLREREEADLSEKERAERRANDAEARAEAAEQRAVRLERSGWIRAAASRSKFADPEDAVALLDLDDFDSERKAHTAVEKLAEQKPHLIRAEGGRPGVGNMGGSGTTGEIPIDPETGKPDVKLGLGRDMLRTLGGGRG